MPMKHRILLLSVFVLLALVSKAQTEKYRNTKAAIREHYAAAYSDCYESRLNTAKKMMVLFQTINANREL